MSISNIYEDMTMSVCRLCCENSGTTDIFNKTNLLSKKIMYCCTNINISEKDGLPKHVCESCEKELFIAYSFILKCEAADAKLRSLETTSTKLEGCEVKDEVELEDNDNINLEDYFNTDLFNRPVELSEEQHIEAKKPTKLTKAKRNKISKKESNQKRSSQMIQQCNDCGKQFKNKSILIIHMRKHSEHRAFECTFCDKKYKDVGALKRHFETNHDQGGRERKFICEACGKSFYTKTALVVHNRTHSGEMPYKCEICAKKFSQLSSMMRHKRRLHTCERSHNCPKCDKKFLTKDEVRNHLVVHTTIKKFICTLCSVPFKYANNLRKHVKLHYQTMDYVCDYCSKIFRVKGSLRRHIAQMHTDKSGFCNVCSKGVSNFEIHMYKHNGKTPFKCGLCSSSFSLKSALTHHINFRHKNSDRYMCSVLKCTKAFPTKPMLLFHVAKYHEAKILFPCDTCSKGFYRKNDLSRHKVYCQKERPEL